MPLQRHAVVAVILREGHVLMVRRGPDAPMAGFWSPPSGRIEQGESQEAAVVREVREELGLVVRPVEKVWECPTHDGGYLLHWWLAEADLGEPRPDPREVSEVRWISPKEFAGLAPTFEAHAGFFEEILPML